ncbi:MAG: ProQ/FINO family protein [Gammaproteobacteria bacterium]
MNTNNPSIVSNKLTLAKRIGKKVMYRVNKTENPPTEAAAKTPEQKQSTKSVPSMDPQALKVLHQQQIQTLLAWLEEKYPNCFNSQAKKPLKIGIHKELHRLHPEVSHRSLTRTLRAYIRSQDYYEAVLKEKKRYDLEGKPCETIRKGDKSQAKVLLEE